MTIAVDLGCKATKPTKPTTTKCNVRIANWEDPDQTASSEAVWSGSALLVYAVLADT